MEPQALVTADVNAASPTSSLYPTTAKHHRAVEQRQRHFWVLRQLCRWWKFWTRHDRVASYEIGGGPVTAVAGYVSGDGPVQEGTRGPVSFMGGDGKTDFGSPQVYPVLPDNQTITSLALAENLDGNGSLDFVAGDISGWVYVAGVFNNAWVVQSLDLPATVSGYPVATSVAVADFNGDGSPDIVVARRLHVGRQRIRVPEQWQRHLRGRPDLRRRRSPYVGGRGEPQSRTAVPTSSRPTRTARCRFC